jgi:hypothetical protein
MILILGTVNTSLGRNCHVKLDFSAKTWRCAADTDWRGGWPAALNFSTDGTFEIRDNGVIWFWDQKPGQQRRNTIIVRDAPTGELDAAHPRGTARFYDPPTAESKDVVFPWTIQIDQPTPQASAIAMVGDFRKRPGRGMFPHIQRDKVADRLLGLIKTPESLDQAQSSFCGPAAFMYTFLKYDPVAFTKYVIDLYDTGQARIGKWNIQPSLGFRFEPLPWDSRGADWIALGSLRDSENWFLEYHRNELPLLNAQGGSIFNFTVFGYSMAEIVEEQRGGTSASEMVKWLSNVGYSKVEDWTGAGMELPSAQMANEYYRKGYRVCLSICSNIFGTHAQRAGRNLGADHWVVLSSPIQINGDTVSFTIFTWASTRTVIATRAEFQNNYFGFVCAGR